MNNAVEQFITLSKAHLQASEGLTTHGHAGVEKLVELNLVEAQKTFNDLIETLTKTVPAGAEAAVAAFKNAMTLGQNAVESAQTSAKKAVEGAQSNLTEVSHQAVNATRKVSKAT